MAKRFSWILESKMRIPRQNTSKQHCFNKRRVTSFRKTISLTMAETRLTTLEIPRNSFQAFQSRRNRDELFDTFKCQRQKTRQQVNHLKIIHLSTQKMCHLLLLRYHLWQDSNSGSLMFLSFWTHTHETPSQVEVANRNHSLVSPLLVTSYLLFLRC